VRSLRRRIVLGTLLWTVGLVVVVNLTVETLFRRRFTGPMVHIVAMTIVAGGLALAGLAQVGIGLWPIGRLRARLKAVRDGQDPRIAGSYPTEVQPLVDDLNGLLEEKERAVARAQAKAGDLAHGLKTPLAVLSQEAERARSAGHEELAATIGQQVERMRRQVDYHLAHARAAASGAALGVRSAVAVSVDGLVRTLLRLHAERGLAFDVRVSPHHAVRAQREDLDEMLGNVLDNACKWAKARIVVESKVEGGSVVVTVDDDGPGLDDSLLDAVLQRGVRADEQAPGSGFGLAIVRDLAELYGGSVALSRSSTGGVRARLELPV
jgi:signal transduction histidine kinase